MNHLIPIYSNNFIPCVLFYGKCLRLQLIVFEAERNRLINFNFVFAQSPRFRSACVWLEQQAKQTNPMHQPRPRPLLQRWLRSLSRRRSRMSRHWSQNICVIPCWRLIDRHLGRECTFCCSRPTTDFLHFHPLRNECNFQSCRHIPRFH